MKISGRILVVLLAVAAFVLLAWRLIPSERRRAGQVYDCAERAVVDKLTPHSTAPRRMMVECLVVRYGWDRSDAEQEVFAYGLSDQAEQAGRR